MSQELTQDQRDGYVKSAGKLCPYCGGGNLKYGDMDAIDGDRIYQEVICTDCMAEWDDIYALIGFGVVSGPQDDEEDE